jgi:hypothetical protein
MDASTLLDAVGVQLTPGQRVLYAAAGMYASGALTPGVIVRAYRSPRGGGERITVRRDDGKTVTITWSRRIVVLRQESEADSWLRTQLASLGAR